jgi:hypothetical protein
MKTNITALFILIALGALGISAQTKVVPILEMKVGGLMGGVLNGQFISAKATAAKLKGSTDYELFTMMGHEEGIMTGKKPTAGEDVCPDFYTVDVEDKADTGVALGEGFKWNPVPRAAASLSLTDPTYVKAASDFLKTKGIVASSPKLTQLYRVDLDGDGHVEVILTATKYSNDLSSTAKKGDYSFTILRTVVAGKVKTILLGGDFITKGFAFGAPNTYEVSSVADLNGDGKMEIILHSAYYEGSESSVYQFSKGLLTPVKVLGIGCGV